MRLPFTQLIFTHKHATAVGGLHLHVLDVETGDILKRFTLEKSIVHRYVAVDASSTRLASAGDDKILRVWSMDAIGDALVLSKPLQKRATSVTFTPDGNVVLVSDKFGDVWSFELEDVTKDPVLVLGHTSMLTAMLVTPDGKHIVTADRDEHIRISGFPTGYDISSFCLGHKKFVSALEIPTFAPDILYSGGGDETIRVWDWKNGKHLRSVDIHPTMPFVCVHPPPRRSTGTAPSQPSKGHKPRLKRARARKQGGVPEDAEEPMDDAASEPSAESHEDFVFALQKIQAVELSGRRQIIFSVTGARAVFYFDHDQSTPEIHHVEVPKPVLDFSFQQTNSVIWLAVDTTTESNTDCAAVSILTWDGAKFSLDQDASPTLRDRINTECAMEGDAAELDAQELHMALTVLPKSGDAEFDAMERDMDVDDSTMGEKDRGKLRTLRALATQGAKRRKTEPE